MNRQTHSLKISKTHLFLLALIFALSLPITVYLNAGRDQNSASAAAEPPIFGDIWARSELFFGTSRPDGTAVGDEKFRRFLDQEVTPRFPDGLTLLTGQGQFKNSNGLIIQEKSKVLILLYPLTDTDASNRIEAIRQAYKNAFQQESVLRVDSRAGVSF
ncbi:MAG: DUF3574 domain-containing protein [Acidobacteria bacterium]|nr:DUF3574 domain-containing protein [Acidobacteriota bacterium]